MLIKVLFSNIYASLNWELLVLSFLTLEDIPSKFFIFIDFFFFFLYISLIQLATNQTNISEEIYKILKK